MYQSFNNMNPIEMRLNVHIHKVRLQVRFACSILAYLNVQNQQIPFSVDQVALQSGETKLQSSASQVFSVLCNPEGNVFSEKNVSINLVLKTAKGRISAGSATIDLNSISKQSQKLKMPLEKCPDKNAQIEASISYQIIDEANESRQTFGQRQITESYTFQDFKLKGQMKNQSVQRSILPTLSNKSQLRISKQDSKALSTAKLELNSSIESLKLDFVKSHTKPVLKSDRSNQKSSSPIQQNKLKSKLGQSERQLKTIHKKYEQASIELRNTHTRLEIAQKSLKQNELQMKAYREKYQDLDRSNSHVQKRNDFKQNNLKEQIKTLTQKLAASDSQRQSLIFQKNKLISEFEQRQRALRLSLRQKQRSLADQKNKLSRKNDQMAKELNSCSIKMGQYDLKLQMLAKQLALQVRKSEALQQTCQSLRLEAEEYRQQYQKQKMKRQQLQALTLQFQQTEQQKKKLRKRIAEQDLQISKLLNTVVNLQMNYKKYLHNSEQMQSALKEKMNNIKALQKQFDNSTKSIDSLKKLLEQKQKAISQLGQQKQKQSAQIQSLNSQLLQSERKHVQYVKALTKEIHDKQVLIQTLYSEINQSKQLAKVYDDKISKFQTHMEELNNQLTQMDHEHDDLKFSKIVLEDTISDLERQIEALKIDGDSKELNWKKQLKTKQGQIKRLQQSLKKLESNNAKSAQLYGIKISQLQDKIVNIQQDLMEKTHKIERLLAQIKTFKQQKPLLVAKIQELQYALGLKGKQIIFLKENADKNHKENIELSTQISNLTTEMQNLNEIIFKNEQQLSSMASTLKQNDEMKSQVHKEFDEYVRLNKQSINSFLSAILGQPNISFLPTHQELDIQSAMQMSLKKINQTYKSYNQKILDLEKQIQEKNDAQSQRLRRHQQAEGQLEQSLKKTQQYTKELETEISSLKTEKISLNNKIAYLQKECNKVFDKNKGLEAEMSMLSNKIDKLDLQNAGLMQKIEGLLESLRSRDEEFSIKSTRQLNKFQQQTFNLKLQIKELQQILKREESNNAQLSSRLAEYKDQSNATKGKSTQEITRLRAQLQNLFALSQKKSKRLEEKEALYLQSTQLQKSLRENLQAASTEIASLKELYEDTKRRYESTSKKQKELDEALCRLKDDQVQLNAKLASSQKSLKETSSELIASRQLVFKMEKEKKRLQDQLDIANALIKVKQDMITRMKNEVATLSKQRGNLGQKIKQNSQAYLEQQRHYQRQIEQLNQSKDKIAKQLSVTTKSLQATKQQLAGLQKDNRQQINQLKAQRIGLNKEIAQLKEKISQLKKDISLREKTTAAQDQYLKPIRDNIQFLRGHLAQYSRVGDQFQSSKNKLLKAASVKSDPMAEKFINERMRQFSVAYNKLKVLVLSCQIEEKAKGKIGDELKKVQMYLDKVLRGQK